MSSSRSGAIYWCLWVAQFLTFSGYVIVTAGAALLQERANSLPLWGTPGADNTDPTNAVYQTYVNVFQSSNYIIPYPADSQYQFQYQWWIIEYEFAIFILTLALTIFPSLIERVRPIALTFLATALVLIMDNVNSLSFLLRDDIAKEVFEEYRIACAQAGLILVGVANGFTIIFLGLYRDNSAVDGEVHVSKPAANV
mmetsp:Transcript_19867/g.59018  ORF Transcript_19867/g.59018 Transcript_19867/m.59018 type:complete len:197 (-) Transcript_19867:321-911(-)